MNHCAKVWRFEDAPKRLRDLSTNGGDEDWLVELPPGFDTYGLPDWVDVMDALRCPQRIAHPTRPGWLVVIASHA